MSGPEVFKYALPKVHSMIQRILKRNNFSQSDIDLLIPHQASGRGVKASSRFGGFSKDKVMDIVGTTGNCVAASLPLALSMAYEQGLIKNDSLIFICQGNPYLQ